MQPVGTKNAVDAATVLRRLSLAEALAVQCVLIPHVRMDIAGWNTPHLHLEHFPCVSQHALGPSEKVLSVCSHQARIDTVRCDFEQRVEVRHGLLVSVLCKEILRVR